MRLRLPLGTWFRGRRSDESAQPTAHGQPRRPWWWAAVIVGAAGVVCGLGAYGYARYINSSPGNVRLYRFVIEEGATARQIGDQLEREGIIGSARFFSLAARLMEFDRHIHAGTHWVDGSKTTLTILRQVLSGGLDITKVTIPEGLTIREVANLVAQALPVVPDSLVALAFDTAYVGRYAFPGAPSLEGFLFPDTYLFDASAGPVLVVRTMAERFHELFTDDMKHRADTLGMSPLEIVTLASIIEKEAMVHKELPIISQVFHKRLKLGYKLGADPTVKYVMEREPRRLSLRDIEVDSPYNTYKYSGLPPGPICNPGIEAMRAALWPAHTDYLYFVSNWDGTHAFTRSLREHNVAKSESARKYRQWRAEQRRRSAP